MGDGEIERSAAPAVVDEGRRLRPGRGVEILLVAAVAVAIAGFILHAGHRDWQLFDLSMVVDSAYRVAIGQRPTVDFICPLPFGFLALGGLAFKVFGVRWSALVDIAALWAVIVFLWQYGLTRRLGASIGWSLGLATACVAVTVAYKSFLYHSAFTTPLSAIVFTTGLLMLRRPRDPLGPVSLAAGGFCLMLGKQNAIPALAIVALTLATARDVRWRALLAIGVAAVFAALVVGEICGSLGAFAEATLAIARARGRPGRSALRAMMIFRQPWLYWLDWLTVAAAAAPLAFSWRRIRCQPRREIALLAGAVIVAALGMATNYDSKIVDLPPLLLAGFMPWALASKPLDSVERASRYGVAALLAGIAAIGVLAGATRITAKGLGERMEWGIPQAPVTDHGGFFEGLEAPAQFAKLERDLDRFEVEYHPPKDKVFFGVALEYAYAAHGFVPPQGLPCWWHPGTSYPSGAEPELLARFESWRPRYCVFHSYGMTQNFPESLKQHIERNYDRRSLGELMIFILRARAQDGKFGRKPAGPGTAR